MVVNLNYQPKGETIMSEVKQEMGRVLFITQMTQLQLMDRIAELNNVNRKTVYGWVKSENDVKIGRLKATLEQIVSDHLKGDKKDESVK